MPYRTTFSFKFSSENDSSKIDTFFAHILDDAERVDWEFSNIEVENSKFYLEYEEGGFVGSNYSICDDFFVNQGCYACYQYVKDVPKGHLKFGLSVLGIISNKMLVISIFGYKHFKQKFL